MVLSYKDAGVDIDAGNALVERIKPFARATKRIGAESALGGFGALFDLKSCGYKDPLLVSTTDGVGTKLKLAFTLNAHKTVGIDLVAMCVNDLLAQGAEPLFFLDYFATSALSVNVAADVIEGIAEGCRQAGAALVGGETAEMPGMYEPGHYDLAGFSVGAVERDAVLPRQDVIAGDVILGIGSSGVHSNGFSLVRKILERAGILFDSKASFAPGKTVGDVLLTPTKIYIRSLLPHAKSGKVKAFAHITGGGLVENPPRVLPKNIGIKIDCASWTAPAVFPWLQSTGDVETLEMLRTFNCGIGMIAVVARGDAQIVLDEIKQSGEQAWVIGETREVNEGDERVEFVNLEKLFGK